MTEHSASVFVFFFLGEYSSLILMSALMTILFFGGFLVPSLGFNQLEYWGLLEENLVLFNSSIKYHAMLIADRLGEAYFFGLKVILVVFLFIWVRASFPRLRYDQLMALCWKALLPLVFAYIIFTLTLLFVFDMLPVTYSLPG